MDESVLAWCDGSMNPELAKRLTASVQEFYQFCGRAFANTRNMVWDEEKEAGASLETGMHVYDIGAGNGRFFRLVPRGTSYVGVEPSASLRAHAVAGATIMDGAFPHLPIPDAISDATMCFAVLHHIPSREARTQAVDELIRITRVEGTIFATSWAEMKKESEPISEGDPGDVWISWKAEGVDAKRYVHIATEEEWKDLWNDPRLEIQFIGKRRPANWFVIAKRVG